MSASIVSLNPAAAPLSSPASVGTRAKAPLPQHRWRGASGRRYTHDVYSLIECPPLPKATYLLVRRDGGQLRRVLHVGIGDSDAPSVNLARVRQRGAQLGANEVHVLAAPRTDAARALVAFDLRAGLFGELAAEPSRVSG